MKIDKIDRHQREKTFCTSYPTLKREKVLPIDRVGCNTHFYSFCRIGVLNDSVKIIFGLKEYTYSDKDMVYKTGQLDKYGSQSNNLAIRTPSINIG